MINPENRPTKRYLPNGKVVPTSKGLVYTEDERTRRKVTLLGRPKSKEGVEKRSTVWAMIRPFYARGGLTRQIAEITGFTMSQITNAISKAPSRPQWSQVEPFVLLGEKDRILRARRFRELRKNPLSDDEKKSIQFARKLQEAGWITQDISYWEELHAIYKQRNRELPDEFIDKLSLEAFLKAIQKADKGNKTWLDQYTKIGIEEIGSEWFDRLNAERRFIRDVVSGKNLNRNGHNGHNIDRLTISEAFRTLKEMGVPVEEN